MVKNIGHNKKNCIFKKKNEPTLATTEKRREMILGAVNFKNASSSCWEEIALRFPGSSVFTMPVPLGICTHPIGLRTGEQSGNWAAPFR